MARCPNCGIEEKEWSESYEKGGETYCCEGCAEGKECVCLNETMLTE